MTIFLVASLQARLLYAECPKKSRQEPCFLAVCGCAGANAGDARRAAGRPRGSPLRRNTSGLRCRGGYQPPAVIPCPGFRVDQGIDPYGVQRASSSVGEGLAPSRQQRGQGTDLPRRNRRNARRAAGRPRGSPLRRNTSVVHRRGRRPRHLAVLASPARGGGFEPLAAQNRRGNPSVTAVNGGDSSPFRGAIYAGS